MTNYETVIGLEVHAQMRTRTKAFCGCSAAFGAPPNTNVCPVCLGHPGTLPVLNKRLVEFIIMMGLATNCSIRPRSIFARKNYFYPDLPKGYQISQYDTPICHDGHLDILGKRIGITRIHMEEDAGKSIHDFAQATLIDFNRAGVPLIEIVSEPDIRSPQEAYAYLSTIKGILTYLGICDGIMEEGSLRCDANVSMRPRGREQFGTRTEVKNLNSFRNVERALQFEIERQTSVLEAGGTVRHETLLWDAGKNACVVMRSKEEAHDYRYFPEPDLVPVELTEKQIATLRSSLPELREARRARFEEMYGLPSYDANVLTEERAVSEYFEQVCRSLKEQKSEVYKSVSNWIMGEVMRLLTVKKISIEEFSVAAETLAELLELVSSGIISNTVAKEIFPEMVEHNKRATDIVRERGLEQVSDPTQLISVIDAVLAESTDQVEKYRAGKTNLFGYFVGQTLKRSGGKANPQLVNEILKKKLEA